MVDITKMATNSSIPAVTTEVLEKLEQYVDGRPVLYATKFVRLEPRGTSSAIPSDGWLIVTTAGLHVFKKAMMGGVGNEIGMLSSDVIAGVSAIHGRKTTHSQITIAMTDQTSATLDVRTAETYPALLPWIRGASTAGGVPNGGLAERLPAVPEAPGFIATRA